MTLTAFLVEKSLCHVYTIGKLPTAPQKRS